MELGLSDSLLLSLGLRMLVSAAVVVVASLAVERVGPFLGAMIATLPLSAGPAYVFLALDHDPSFVASSAVGSLVSLAATAVYLLVYILIAPRRGTAVSIAAALAAWACALAALEGLSWSLPAALTVALAGNVGTAVLTADRRRTGIVARVRTRWWHIAIRAMSVMALVLTVTIVGHLLGPHAAGLLALVPIVFTSLAAMLQPRLGGEAVASVMANGVLGMIGYVFALGLLSLAAVPLGSMPTLALALGTCLAWNGLRMLARRAG